jgi:hypothetical protein
MTLLLLLLACPQTVSKGDDVDYFPDDEDGDGWTVEEGDCDDNDRSVNPGASENWDDEIDQNCDGNIDDEDGDGSKRDKDCDDTDPTTYPRAPELCDGKDNDCNGRIDDNPEEGVSLRRDADGDGFASESDDEVVVCEGAEGYTDQVGDCDDDDADVYPGAHELCNGEDDDCDGEVDEEAVDTVPFYRDEDADGHGDATQWVRSCTLPEGYATADDDCDDTRADLSPDVAEGCDGVDNDCNGLVDDDAVDAATVYDDLDGDGHGVAGTGRTACPDAGAPDELDCDDTDATVYGGAPEACDLVDNDCDGEVDEDVTYADYYTDSDGDGHGDPASFVVNDCVAPAGAVANDDDCDDTSADVSPVEVERCDGLDNDCDGEVDVGARDASTFYADADGDGYGVDDDAQDLCAADGVYSATLTGDCDDADVDTHPGATELDNDEDDDCDTMVDEDFVSEGDVLIVEIARQTWMGGTSTDPDGQWFEVANLTSDPLDLSGWTITRTSSVGTDSFAVDPASALVIPAGDVAVFCATDLYSLDADPDSILECNYTWGDPDLPDTWVDTYVDNSLHLQRDEDSLSLSAGATTVDTVTWDAAWPAGATQSMVFVGTTWDAAGNDVPEAWSLDATNVWWADGSGAPEYGTPGAL